jgi:hypothetical protein
VTFRVFSSVSLLLLPLGVLLDSWIVMGLAPLAAGVNVLAHRRYFAPRTSPYLWAGLGVAAFVLMAGYGIAR